MTLREDREGSMGRRVRLLLDHQVEGVEYIFCDMHVRWFLCCNHWSESLEQGLDWMSTGSVFARP